MRFITVLSLSVILLGMNACDNDDVDSGMLDCTFVNDPERRDGEISAEERRIMQDCDDNAISVKEFSEIFEGEWRLIGHGEGWIPTKPQPCSNMVVTDSEITMYYKDEFIDTTTTHVWEIGESPSGPFLSIEPRFMHGAFPAKACEGYFYSDATPLDGNMYLYEKVAINRMMQVSPIVNESH